MTPGLTPLDIVYGARLENGQRWGHIAGAQQKADAEAFFSPDGPSWHYITRPRGGSKTTDLALFALGWLVCEAPKGSTGSVLAASSDQAELLIEALAGAVQRSQSLRRLVDVSASHAVNKQTGARVEVMAADGASVWGRRDHLVILDEFGQWAITRKSRRVWIAMLTTVQKTPGAKLAIITSAGEPGHFSHPIWQAAGSDPHWRRSDMPGPVSWQSEADLAAIRKQLREDEYDRLILNRWTSTPDMLVSPEDLSAALVLDGDQPPRPGIKYKISLDYGPKRDRTVVTVVHAERATPGGPAVMVCDHMWVRQGSRLKPVSLEEVEAHLVELSKLYHHAPVHADPYQAIGLIQRLNASGVRAYEFPFTTSSVGRLANALHVALRNRQLKLPDDPELRDELSRVRLKDTAVPGVVRLDHDGGQHDDRAVALGICICTLEVESRQGAAFLAMWAAQQAEDQNPKVQHVYASLATDGPLRASLRDGCRHRFMREVNGEHCVNCYGWRGEAA